MFGSLVPYQCGEIAIDVFGGGEEVVLSGK